MPKNYKPEERLQVATCQMLHALAPASILYFHPAQEAIRSKATWGYQIEMGFVKGVSDWIIMGRAEDRVVMLAVELKAGREKASENQLEFQRWCTRAGIRWAIMRSVRAFGSLMTEEGVFTASEYEGWCCYKLPLLAAQLNMPQTQIG